MTSAGVKVSMDGRGRWMDNVFIERLWRSLKYECIYLHAFETRAGIAKWVNYYNTERPRSEDGHRQRLTTASAGSNWRHDGKLNQAYGRRQTVRDSGASSVRRELDQNTYPAGIKVSGAGMDAVNLTRHGFHGEWNYTVSPKVLALER